MRLEEKREFTFEVTFLPLYPVALPLLKLFNLSLVLAPSVLCPSAPALSSVRPWLEKKRVYRKQGDGLLRKLTRANFGQNCSLREVLMLQGLKH